MDLWQIVYKYGVCTFLSQINETGDSTYGYKSKSWPFRPPEHMLKNIQMTLETSHSENRTVNFWQW